MSTQSFNNYDHLVACPACDWLHTRPDLSVGSQARCERCDHVICTYKRNTVDRTLAAALAAMVLLLVSLYLPFLALARSGFESNISVLDAVTALWFSKMEWLALVTFGFIVLLPLLRLGLISWVLWQLMLNEPPTPAMRTAFHWAEDLEPWAMAEIFMVGVVVSLVKISSVATLTVGPAFWCLLALIVVTTLVGVYLCRDTVWRRLVGDPEMAVATT